MKAAEWIDRVKVARGWESDYRAAKELGLSRNTISTYRGRSMTFDENTAIKVAEALGERAEAVLLDQYAENTKNPAVRQALSEAARRLCVLHDSILCKVKHAAEFIANNPRKNCTCG